MVAKPQRRAAPAEAADTFHQMGEHEVYVGHRFRDDPHASTSRTMPGEKEDGRNYYPQPQSKKEKSDRERPPSPLRIYDYGSANVRTDKPSKFVAPEGQGYGITLLDPIFMRGPVATPDAREPNGAALDQPVLHSQPFRAASARPHGQPAQELLSRVKAEYVAAKRTESRPQSCRPASKLSNGVYSDAPSSGTEMPLQYQQDARAGTPVSRPKTVFSSAPRTTTPMSARSDRSGKSVTFLDNLFVESRAELQSLEQKRRARLAAQADSRREALQARKKATDAQMLRQRQPFAVARAAGRIPRPPQPKQETLLDDRKAGFVYADEQNEAPSSAMLDLDRFDLLQRENEKDHYVAAVEEELAAFVGDNSDSD